MKVLITGGLGYIGARLANDLLQVVPSLSLVLMTRKPPMVLPSLLSSCEVKLADLQDSGQLLSACQGVDCIIHLAAVNEIICAKDPITALSVNGLGSLKLLEAAKSSGVKRFIYFSTAHIYASPLEGHITEATLPRPVHPYATSHKAAEDLVIAAHDKGDIEGIVLRLSNSFGAPLYPEVNRWSLLLNDVAKQVVQNRMVCLRSFGLQQRDFITLADVSAVVQHFLFSAVSPLKDIIFNVGSGKSLSIYDMTKRLTTMAEKLWGDKIPINRPEVAGSNNKVSPLHYDVAHLLATGVSLKNNVDAELEALLMFCQNAFTGIA